MTENFDLWKYFIETVLPRFAYWLTMSMMPAGIGASIICCAQLNNFELPKRRKILLQLLCISVIVYLFMHLLREVALMEYRMDFFTVLLYIVTFIEFLSFGCIIFFVSLYLFEAADLQRMKRPIVIFFCILLGIYTLLLIIAQFNGMYYTFPVLETNDGLVFTEYARGGLYFISNIAPGVMMITDLILLAKYGKRIHKRIATAFWIFILLPITAAIVQLFYDYAQFIIWALVIAMVVVYTEMMRQATEEYKRQKTESAQLETELSMASRIQESMLPRVFPAFPERKEFDIYASMNPAKEVGGDFYNFFMIDDDTFGFIMADVSGKGVPAALFMMSSDIMLKNYTLMNKDPKATLEEVNRQICANNSEGMFVTVWLGILDLKTGKLTAANAGHEKPAIKSSDGSFELYQDKHGLMVGYLDYVKYRDYELQLEKGSKLFLYTDGVSEATNASEELFGTGRMIEALRSAEEGTPEEILQAVDRAVSDFVKDAPQFDDITMLCLEYKGSQDE